MADIFISFKTSDTRRAGVVYDALKTAGFTVFWSNDIPTGSSDYQEVIIREITDAPVVAVIWTTDSVKSHPVRQECAQAKKHGKLIQIVLDEIEPIYFPMEVEYVAQKAQLIGWSGDISGNEWIKLVAAIEQRVGRHKPSPSSSESTVDSVEYKTASASLQASYIEHRAVPESCALSIETAQRRKHLIRQIVYGRLVSGDNGPIASGAEPRITAQVPGLPADVLKICRPDILIPGYTDKWEAVEDWQQERGGIFILPVLRSSEEDRLWCLAGRIRPYPERGPGNGGEPTSLMTIWAMPAAEWAIAAPSLLPQMAAELVAQPELDAIPESVRFARAPVSVPSQVWTKSLKIATVPRTALLMLDAICHGQPTVWTRDSFSNEQEFLACLAIVLELIPIVGRTEPRALLSVSSGLVTGREKFFVSYLRDAAPSKYERSLPRPWLEMFSRNDLLVEIADRASKFCSFPDPQFDSHQLSLGHFASEKGKWAAETLVEALRCYRLPPRPLTRPIQPTL